MYYEERWIGGKFCWRTSPNGAWTAYTANELAHRYQAELQRAHDPQRALDAEREKVKRLSTCGTDHSTPWWQVKCEDLEAQLATLQAQLADRDAMILQMGEQAAVLAKENMAVKAQLRQVEDWRDKVRNLEEAYQRVKNSQLMYRVMYLEIYRSLQAQQKGCIRLRKRLDKLLGKQDTREGREG